jgi:EmrB/QacA subfamily drug resistance transporter
MTSRGRPVSTGVNVSKEQRWVLGLTSVASLMAALDLLVVATAMTTIQRDLHASLESLEWTVNAYALSFAALLMTAAALGDRWGRRRVFTAGLGLFGLASIACALAPNVEALIAARALQGIGAATVMPLAMALLSSAFPPEQRGRALGIFSGVTGLAVLGGPLVGGAVTEGLAWPWIFWVNVPIAVVLMVLAPGRLPESTGPQARIDVVGLLLQCIGSFGLVWGLVRANSSGWGSAEVLTALVLGVLVLAAFIGWEARTAQPMLPIRLFANRRFSAGNFAGFLLYAALLSEVFFITQFLQVTMGVGPLGAGLRVLPWTATLFLIAPVAGGLVDRIGERALLVGGLALQAIGMGWISLANKPDLAYGSLVVPLIIAGIGVSTAMPAAQKAVLASVPPAAIGKASGTFNTLRQLGGAVGVAVLAAVFAGAGGYASPAEFSAGFGRAIGVAAALSLGGALAGCFVTTATKEATNEQRVHRPLQDQAQRG